MVQGCNQSVETDENAKRKGNEKVTAKKEAKSEVIPLIEAHEPPPINVGIMYSSGI